MSAAFGDTVRRGREDAGLSQSRLAQLIGKSPTTIRAWEHGRTNPADPQAVAAVAAVLGLDESELLGQAGFETPTARARPSARQELTSLATERTEMIALAPPVDVPGRSKPIEGPSQEFGSVGSPVIPEIWVEPTRQVEITIEPVKVPPTPIPPLESPKPTAEPQGEIPKPTFRMPRVVLPKAGTPKVRMPKVRVPKVRVLAPQQATPAAPNGGSNGFVAGRSYLEDEAEKDFYRRRGIITATVLVFMVIVIWWALGRTGGAIGDLIESITGLLDI